MIISCLNTSATLTVCVCVRMCLRGGVYVCVTFPLPAYGIPCEYFTRVFRLFIFVPPSLALPLLLCSLRRYRDVSSLCPSLPLSLSLSPSIAL